MLDPQQIEDIYPLTPMQRGMLFHSLYAPRSAVYFQQEGFRLQGRLERAAFVRAWELVLARHSILRTAIVWEGLDEPVQVVFRQVPLPLEQHDWRAMPAAAQPAALAAFAQADRERGFDTVVAPLMRLALIQLADDTYHFIWSRHHLLLDGWSVALLLKEALHCYAALCQGRAPGLDRPQPYREYLAWLQRQDTTQAEQFWRAGLAGLHAPTPLGVDHPSVRPAGQEQYGEQWAQITPATTAALQALARAQRVTLNTLFQGAWALMLSRYSGQEDVLFGATNSGRPTTIAGIEHMAGLFINTLPVRVRVAPNQPLAAWLQRLLAHQAESRQYNYSSLVDIQRWSELPRGTPLFNSLLVFENFPAISEDELAGDLLVRSEHSFECTNYPLNLAVLPRDGLALRAIYDIDRFDHATITRLLGHLQTLLAAMLADPQQRLGALPIVSAAERRQLVGPAPGAQPAAAPGLAQQFEQQAARAPLATALIFERRQLSYHALNERANQLAHYLRARGVGPELRVGLYLERSLDLAVGLLAVLKAGGACLPLDPAEPHERLAGLLDAAGATLLLTQDRLAGGMPAIPARQIACVRIDADWPAIEREPRDNPPPAHPATLALACAGAGPGALIDQGALAGRLAALQQACPIGPGDTTVQLAGLAAEAAIWELLWPLAYGARLVLALPAGHDDPAYLRALLAEHSVSQLHLAGPALAARLAAWAPALPQLPALRMVLCSGEPAPATSVAQLGSMGARLIQLYGPAEAGPQRLAHTPSEPGGAPALYILDQALEPLPLGVIGELYVAEPGLARGSLAGPAATALAFVPNPFAATPGARMYRTGERARRLGDGTIELAPPAGRLVWLGDRRADMDAIEAALLTDPAVGDCAVLARTTPAGTRALVAYVVPAGAYVPEQLAARLRRRLPAALCPAAYIPLAQLPLTAGGALDQPALAQIELVDAELLQRWETQIQALPTIAQAVVLAHQPAERPAPLHLSDVIAGWNAPPAALSTAPEPAPARPFAWSDAPGARPALADGGPLLLPAGAPATLADALIATAARYPQHGITYIQSDGTAIEQSYPELLHAARCVLAGLQARGCGPGSRAILQLEQLSEHLPAFWACILGGITPATIMVAPAYDASNSTAAKLYNAWELLGHPPIVASAHLLAPIAGLAGQLPMAGPTLLPIDELRRAAPTPAEYQPAPHAVAFLQLTSGSTGIPRCIQETHQAVISYIHASQQVNQLSAGDVALNWLPIDHVGALLMFHIRDLYLGCRQIQARTDMILAEPLAWLDLIERFRVTHSWSPNFGYKLLADRLGQAHGRSWDLASVRELLNGGEQVTLAVVREFLERAAPFGLAPAAMQPAYGMAETCTAMTHARQFSLAGGVNAFEKRSLSGQLRRAAPGDPDPAVFVAVGPPNPGVQIRITDPANQLLPEGVIGRLQVRGAIVTPGYLNNPDANAEAFTADGWFYTGDLGMILDGQLTITGREKEVIIINGANYYCYEIEDVVRRVAGVDITCVGVCEVDDPHTGSEGIAICFVPTVAAPAARLEVVRAIRARVVAGFGLNPAAIVPLAPEQFPKTTSGKIQRLQLKAALAGGQFQAALKALDLQLENSNTLPGWFFRRCWRPRQLRAARPAATGQVLILLDRLGLGAALAAALGTPARPCIVVEPAADFAQIGPGHYQVAPGEPLHYQRLFAALARDGVPIDQIVHLWAYDTLPPAAPASFDALEPALERGVYSLLFLAQALQQAHAGDRPVQLLVVASAAQPVAPGDPLACERATALGLLKSIPHELPWLSCRHLDLPLATPAASARLVLSELGAADTEHEIAYRQGRRLVARLEPAAPGPQPAAAPFKRGGMYLLSGGLGGIGSLIAAYLCERYDARLLLLGRTPLPTPAGDGEPLPPQLAAWRQLQQRGGALIYEALDIADGASVQQALERAQRHWQCTLDGVLHLAGVYHDELLADATRASFAATLRPKLAGALVLDQLARRHPGCLFISFSSAHSLFGGLGVGAYAAANSFLDAFAHAQRQSGLDSYCLAWSIWDERGISRGLADVQARLHARGYASIAPQQGLYALLAGLGYGQPYLAIGLDQTRAPIRRMLAAAAPRMQIARAYVAGAGGPAPAALPPELAVYDRFGTRSACEYLPLDALPLDAAGRPDRSALAALSGAQAAGPRSYSPPQSEIERTIAAIWQAALRLEQVGIHDNFFDLGGQSLLMTQVQGKLRATLQRDISMVDMFKYPTISALAAYLSQPAPAAQPAATDRSARQREAIARQKQQALRRRKTDD
ncbi:MAG: AMP-binding protein [Kouleothrix sp.]|jgi:non-ribosomal peptide synthetase component F/NADP-dependent 3-hydroxy acid dehydrogenase YdfG|nr:AMP-binding protein [Kouleothrix sp.]